MKSPDGEWPIKYTYSIHETRSPISPFANKFVSLFKVTPFSQGTHLVGGGGGKGRGSVVARRREYVQLLGQIQNVIL